MASVSARRQSLRLIQRLGKSVGAYLRVFWRRAYRENITGLSGMVAYNLMLALFPFALLVLFVVGKVIQSPNVEESVLMDLEDLFPAVELDTLDRTLERIKDNSTTIGVAAAVAAIWLGTSFWGALDTAFCRIYHVKCRDWVEQKRFALGMLVVVMLLFVASVAIPAVETMLISGAEDLPFGLDQIEGRKYAVLVVAVALIFVIGCLVYYLVPKGHMPWRGVWPGALFLTVGAALANWLFPFYLVQVSSVDDVGGVIGFILIALIWFYVLSLMILAGAVINALRYELHDTGTLSEGWSAIKPE